MGSLIVMSGFGILCRQMWVGLILRIMQSRKTRQYGAGLYVSGDRRVSVTERMVRLAERDERLAADTRTDTQRLLGDPPSAQSALGRRASHANLAKIISDLIGKLRRCGAKGNVR